MPGWFNIPVTENLSTTSILQTSSTPTRVELTLPQTSTTLTTSMMQAPSTFTGVELTTPQTSTTQTSKTVDLSSLNLQNVPAQTPVQTPCVASKAPHKQIHSRVTKTTATHQVSSETISEENFMLVESSDNEDDSSDKDFTVDDNNDGDDNDDDDDNDNDDNNDNDNAENEDRIQQQQQPSTSVLLSNVQWTHNCQQGNLVPKALQNPQRLCCNKCPRSYTTMWDLKIHKANRCGKIDDKPHKCLVCQRGFANVISMREHKARDHDGVPPYTCQEYGDNFFSGSKLSKHKKR